MDRKVSRAQLMASRRAYTTERQVTGIGIDCIMKTTEKRKLLKMKISTFEQLQINYAAAYKKPQKPAKSYITEREYSINNCTRNKSGKINFNKLTNGNIIILMNYKYD